MSDSFIGLLWHEPCFAFENAEHRSIQYLRMYELKAWGLAWMPTDRNEAFDARVF